MKSFVLGVAALATASSATAQTRPFFWQCNAAVGHETYWSSIREVATGESIGAIDRRNEAAFAEYLRSSGHPADSATCWESGSKDAAIRSDENGKSFASQRDQRNVDVGYDPH
jgi:hypothetical protein